MHLEIFRKAYYNGKPLISDQHYDALEAKYGEQEGLGDSGNVPHLHEMYSQQKVFDDEPIPTECRGKTLIKTPKLDGAAISLLYEDGFLVRGLTRGDGSHGKDITNKVLVMDSIPPAIDMSGKTQITGEVVSRKEAENARNTVAGALGLKDIQEFKERELYFVAYSITIDEDVLYPTKFYTEDMEVLESNNFETVLSTDFDKFKTDGTVHRVNSNVLYYESGFTSKHPRGAYAHKKKSDVAIEESVLLDVIWQTGASGKVTPVAIIDEVIIDDAKINRVTLHNVGFVEQLDLDIGDEILITRSGGVIPKMLGNITKELYA
ncbi:MAG: DNA ligase [Desulfobacteraceae bacterium]|nr:DNA ligase [Desulfobacteraceae bacterium]